MTKSTRTDVTLVSTTMILASFGILFNTLVTGVQATLADECKTISVTTLSYLCSKPSSDKSFACSPGEGFVVRNLVAASNLTDKYCIFTNTHLVNVTCMRNLTGLHKTYDDIIMDIVEKVSGKHKISEMSVIKPLPFGDNAESAFVAFENLCRPVDPDREDVINICSNETATSSTRVYLTMKGGNQTVISQEPSVCNCYIESSAIVTLRALDIRLLNYNTGKCDVTELKMSSDENPHTETCREKSVLLDTIIFTGNKTVNLTLGQVSADIVPTAVWIEILASGDYPVSVTCGGPVLVKQKPQLVYESNYTLSRYLIILIIIGSLFIILVIILIILIRRGVLSMPSKCRHDGTRSEGYKKGISESSSGPVYSQPHRPVPADISTFTFDTEIENTYAEPGQGSGLSHVTASTPPPIPSSPPGSPTSTSSGKVSGGVQPPPKPQRTLPLDTAEDPDDYDHLTVDTHSFRSKKKPPAAVRDKENNIFSKGQGARAPKQEDSKDYDHVDTENEYSEISMPKAGNTNFRMPR